MIRRPPRSTLSSSSAASDVYKRQIMGLDRPNAGDVTLDGRRYHDLRWPLREVGALLEATAVHPGRSARNHLLSLAQTNAIPKERVDEVLELVGLTAVAVSY